MDIVSQQNVFQVSIDKEMAVWENEKKLNRLRIGDKTLWTNADENKWVGWITASLENSELQRIQSFSNEIRSDGFTDAVLIGMGGSSLFPAMMADVFKETSYFFRLHILDSTHPSQIRRLEKKINLRKTFFIIASKSGATLETITLEDYFYARLQAELNKADVGNYFVAITDPKSPLEKIAQQKNFKAIFYGVSTEGGRYSALSNFGMLPSGLMGVDVKKFLSHAKEMQNRCMSEVIAKNNPGVLLGVTLGVAEKLGKNKVTLIISPEISALGGWIEQLLAESTNKNGKGLILIDQEKLGKYSVYGDDRLFVYIRSEKKPDFEQDRAIDILRQLDFLVITLTVPDMMHLGAEIFRWEVATAVAASIMNINPFDQPDVQESKIHALKLIDHYKETGKFKKSYPLIYENNMTLYTNEKNFQMITKFPCISDYVCEYLNQIEKSDYLCISAFIEMSDENIAILQKIRTLIRDYKKVATCFGFGPRFLHSTGQAHKGGSNTGVFIQITENYPEDIEVPNNQYSFGDLVTVQAQADFDSLIIRSRRILRIHLEDNMLSRLEWLYEQLQETILKR